MGGKRATGGKGFSKLPNVIVDEWARTLGPTGLAICTAPLSGPRLCPLPAREHTSHPN